VTATAIAPEAQVKVEAVTAPATDRGSLVQRVRRCLSVSVITTAISITTLVTFTAFLGVEAWIANIIATSVATVPSFHLNRRWTWGRTDATDPLREMLPFWIMAFCGLALSTVTVGIANSWAAQMHLPSSLQLGAILAGHLGGFGLLWVGQFVILDRVLFAPTRALTPTPAFVSERGPDQWGQRPVA
jgi:putative flippase GtrA